ncbi:MAG: UDP-glucose 4-epimerase GalE [Rhodospirillaceae bacterium]
MAIILVTGGAGYVGSHACKALAAADHTPVTFDNLSYGHREAVKWGPLEVGDLLEREKLAEVIARYKPVAVMHFAALAIVSESISQPERYFLNNVEGTRNLLDEMKAANIRRLVFSSTCAVYGIPETIPISESESAKPISPYGESKLRVEQMLKLRQESDGLSSFALRYFNAAGADADGDIGEDHDPEPHLIPNVLKAASGDGNLVVCGDTYPTEDGTCVRDYIHVSDLADAHVLALNFLEKKQTTAVANLGTGTGYSVLEVIKEAERVTGKKIPFEVGPARPGDPPSLIANGAYARDLLKWVPRRSDLHTLISDAWRWSQSSQSPL